MAAPKRGFQSVLLICALGIAVVILSANIVNAQVGIALPGVTVPPTPATGPVVQVKPVPAWTLGLEPPPGTLGRTYLKPTRPIPHDKHPRTAMLRVILPKGIPLDEANGQRIKVSVLDIEGNYPELDGYLGKDGCWHFDSKPLYPGSPHIFDVVFEIVRNYTKMEIRYGQRFEVPVEDKVRHLGFRRVRLIPGRVVTLDYNETEGERYVMPYPPYPTVVPQGVQPRPTSN